MRAVGESLQDLQDEVEDIRKQFAVGLPRPGAGQRARPQPACSGRREKGPVRRVADAVATSPSSGRSELVKLVMLPVLACSPHCASVGLVRMLCAAGRTIQIQVSWRPFRGNSEGVTMTERLTRRRAWRRATYDDDR